MESAYGDHPVSIGCGQTISAPHMHAMCLELLLPVIGPDAKILDVGSGSGYLSVALSLLAGKGSKVTGIERHNELLLWSINNVKSDHPELLETGALELKIGDGWKGEPEKGPFDAIHVGAAAATVPQALVDQLKPGGRMIIPVGDWDQHLYRIDKELDGTVKQHRILGVRYVPLVMD